MTILAKKGRLPDFPVFRHSVLSWMGVGVLTVILAFNVMGEQVVLNSDSTQNEELIVQEEIRHTNQGNEKGVIAADTLDLADHAKLALNYLKGNMDLRGLGRYKGAPGAIFPVVKGQPYHNVILNADHPLMEHVVGDDVASIGMGAIIQARSMLGIEEYLEEENILKELMMGFIQPNGAIVAHGTHPAYALDSFITWYAVSEDEAVKDMIERDIEALQGSNDHYLIDPLARWYEITESDSARVLADRLTSRFVNESSRVRSDGSFIPTPQGEIPPGFETGWDPNGHVESKIRPGAGVLRFAIATGNVELIEWSKKLFDYVESFSGGIGWYPESLFFRGYSGVSGCETCCIRSMLLMGILLAKAGYPAYWNNVERAARNHLVESQLQDTSWVKRRGPSPEETPRMTYREVPERVLGGFAGWSDPNDWVGKRMSRKGSVQIMHCCISGTEALYIVWHNIVTQDESGVSVNLLLNRDSNWVRVNSHMPYEGKVELFVHNAPALSVRVPDWVSIHDVHVFVDDREVDVLAEVWHGGYVRLTGLKPGQKVTITFPQREIAEEKFFAGRTYTLSWRGDTVVNVSPNGVISPTYQRGDMQHGRSAPLKRVVYHVPDKEVPW